MMVQLGPKQLGVCVLKRYFNVNDYAFFVHIVTTET